jgi:hypothetical protein
LSLFPEDRCEGLLADASIVGAKLLELRLRRPNSGKLQGAPNRIALDFCLRAGKASAMSRSSVRENPRLERTPHPIPSPRPRRPLARFTPVAGVNPEHR